MSSSSNAIGNVDAVAMDAICIVGPTGVRYSTEIYAKFYRTTGVAGTFISIDRKRMECDSTIEMSCNGIPCNDKVISFLGAACVCACASVRVCVCARV